MKSMFVGRAFLIVLVTLAWGFTSSALKSPAVMPSTMDHMKGSISDNLDVVRAIGTLLHLPYILTLDSQDPRAVQLAGFIAALPTSCKVGLKFFEKRHDRFFKLMLWDVPKFAAYSAATAYDVINVLNPEHMVGERERKGEVLGKLKFDQAANLAVEFLLRIISCVARYKAEDLASIRGERDLRLVAKLTSELADIVELWRLLSRYNTYSTVPGLDVALHFEVRHAGALEEENAASFFTADVLANQDLLNEIATQEASNKEKTAAAEAVTLGELTSTK